MPPKAQVSREKMLDTIMELIDADGWDCVSARSIAHRLGISTQPIYREFGDMKAVKDAAIARTLQYYVAYVADKIAAAENNALAQSLAYVSFASEHRHLFELIYESRALKALSMKEMRHELIDDNRIIETLTALTGLDTETVYDYHFFIWMALHGLASISAANNIQWDEDEVADFTRTLSRALIHYYQTTERNQEHHAGT